MRGRALWRQISIFFKGEVGHQVVTGKPLIFPCWLQVQHRKTTEQAGKALFAKAPSPRVAVTFPPDHQGQLPCVRLPAGFDEHHHLVMGVF